MDLGFDMEQLALRIEMMLPGFQVAMRPQTAVSVIGLLQLALRHPGIREKPNVKDSGEMVAQFLIDQVRQRDAQVADLLELGWRPENDRTDQEWEAAAGEQDEVTDLTVEIGVEAVAPYRVQLELGDMEYFMSPVNALELGNGLAQAADEQFQRLNQHSPKEMKRAQDAISSARYYQAMAVIDRHALMLALAADRLAEHSDQSADEWLADLAEQALERSHGMDETEYERLLSRTARALGSDWQPNPPDEL
jgi:hypothetical protein